MRIIRKMLSKFTDSLFSLFYLPEFFNYINYIENPSKTNVATDNIVNTDLGEFIGHCNKYLKDKEL